jgi:molybdenum cofactor cytidylyltransferase
MKAAGLITVAGQSLRMGAFKPLLPINGKPMIAYTADVFSEAGITDLFVVVGKQGDAVMDALSGRNARFLWNNAYEETEMFASIQIGLNAILRGGGFDSAFLLPGDMPAVPPAVLQQLVEELERGNWDAVFPSNGTRRLHPPLVRASCFDPLIAYSGDDGLRGAFRALNCRIGYVVTPETGCSIDVDTPEDYARVQRHLSAPGKGEHTA